MAPHILPRDDSVISSTTANYIAGSMFGGFLLISVSIYLIVRFQRSKMSKKRFEERGAAFLHVRGVVRPMMGETDLSPARTPPPFGRDRLTGSIIMPEKTLTRKPTSPGSSGKIVVASQLALSPITSPFPAQRPRSTGSCGSPRARAISILNPAHPQHSRSSSGFSGFSQVLFPPGLHSRESSLSSTCSSQARPVRQLFEPVLPDELALVRYNESLTVLQSFDDGWCLVARDSSRSFRASRLSARMKSTADHVEFGLVPAWIFVKPLDGLVVTRPVRSTSVDALRLGQHPTRDAIIS